jgi:hypothetical protein
MQAGSHQFISITKKVRDVAGMLLWQPGPESAMVAACFSKLHADGSVKLVL